MMQFLKSILSRSDRDSKLSDQVEKLQRDLDEAHANIEQLNDAVKALAHSYVTLSNELMCVSDIIQQAVKMAKQSDYDLLSLTNDADDGGGYLN